jgi:hypothetical protein
MFRRGQPGTPLTCIHRHNDQKRAQWVVEPLRIPIQMNRKGGIRRSGKKSPGLSSPSPFGVRAPHTPLDTRFVPESVMYAQLAFLYSNSPSWYCLDPQPSSKGGGDFRLDPKGKGSLRCQSQTFCRCVFHALHSPKIPSLKLSEVFVRKASKVFNVR